MRETWSRVKALFRASALDRELDDELAFHIEEQAAEYMRSGMTREEAFRAARRDFGGVEQVKEAYRERRGIPLIESLFADLRYGFRILVRNPGFTAAALVTLALGIGAVTAVFTVVHAAILRPLPYPESERLMAILSTRLGSPSEGFYSAPGVYLDWRNRANSFESVAGAMHSSAILSGVGHPRVVSVVKSSADFLSLLGARPLAGRLFAPGEDSPGHGNVALVNEAFWRTELGGNDSITGSPLTLGGRVYTIIGIVPDVQFGPYGGTDIWMPLEASGASRSGGSVLCIGRLRQGVTRESAQSEMETVMSRIRAEHQQDSKTGVLVQPLREWAAGESRRPMFLLSAAVMVLLLIGCANIANLLLARATVREREMAIRTSLGAGRLRLARQALVESLLLAALGGVAGTLLASVLVRIAPTIQSFRIPRAHEISVDRGMLFIAFAATLACGLLFGLAPAWQSARAKPAGRLGNRLRHSLVAGQLALALMLMSAAGLLVNSLVRLMGLDLGFERTGLVTIQTRLPYERYQSASSLEFHRRLAEEVSRMPGVLQTALSDYTPLQAVQFPFQLFAGANRAEAMARHASPGYFAVAGIPVLAGRGFETADFARKPVPVLINSALSRALFGSGAALGGQIRTKFYRDRPLLEVIGVVSDARQLGLRRDPGFQIYFPISHGSIGYVLARVAPNAGDLAPAVRAASASIDPEVPAPEVGDLDATFSREIAAPRFHSILFSSFAALGLLLASIGVYGVMAYAVARRTREFGVRLALGATKQNLLALILGSGARLALAGTVVGTAGSIAVTRLLRVLLYGVEPGDPMTLAGVVAVLAAAALAACWFAARRVYRIDANAALRCE